MAGYPVYDSGAYQKAVEVLTPVMDKVATRWADNFNDVFDINHENTYDIFSVQFASGNQGMGSSLPAYISSGSSTETNFPEWVYPSYTQQGQDFRVDTLLVNDMKARGDLRLEKTVAEGYWTTTEHGYTQEDTLQFYEERCIMIKYLVKDNTNNTIKAWKSPNPADNHIIATLHCYEPGDFCIWGNRKAYDAKHTQNRLDQLFPKMKAHFTDNGIPLILGELNADIRYYDAEHLQPNEDARIRWIWHYTNEARKYGFPIILWECGGSKGMGLIDRFKIKWANEAFVDAFLGATRGTMDEAGAIELAKKAKVSLSSIYEKTDDVLRWKIASDSYARVWGQTMGFGNLNGNGVCMRYLSSDDKGNLIVNTKGQGGNMLHQQFWADQSLTARRTYKAYVVPHRATPRAGRKLCFTLTARNGSTAFVQGFFRIPGIKDTIPFGADWGKPGCLAATPDNPVRHVEVPIPPTEAVWKAASSGGISMELKFFPGPWNSGKALDCVLSPITLK